MWSAGCCRYGALLNRSSVNSLFTLIGLCLLGAPALANDGGIAFGGNPGLLRGHPSVTMTSEVIHIDIYDQIVKVDCDFVFTNHGPACTVRMGFPDIGKGAYDPDEEGGAEVMKTPPKTTFDAFHSYVNGKQVSTRLIRADKEGHYWHTKTVRFAAHSTRHVRDLYTQSIGGGLASLGKDSDWGANQVGYIVHTGASWHGPIGRTEIVVAFHGKEIRGTPAPIALRTVAKRGEGMDGRELKVDTLPANAVVWHGPCAPEVRGRTLRFIRTHWRPTEHDDLTLTYGYSRPTDSSPSKN